MITAWTICSQNWLEEKRKKGFCSRNHYSDLLGMSVLAKYVGICIDSTFFCIGRSLENYIKMHLWSTKRPHYLQCTIRGFFCRLFFELWI